MVLYSGMFPLKPLPLWLLFAGVMCAPAPAQTAPQPASQSAPQSLVQGWKTLPPPAELADAQGKSLPAPQSGFSGVPFALSDRSDTPHSVGVRSAGDMTRQDRDLEADAESSIRERAGFENLEFNQGDWTYQQLVCPALPNHLFLRFTRDNGTRQMSMFSAAIPRNGQGRVHIIPIVRKGYSLFSPAPIGALTIAAFNRIRTEENAGAHADWLGVGLCYAALAGANPQAGERDQNGSLAATIAPTLVVAHQGGATIRFADWSTAPRPMEWKMTFDTRGKLVRATHVPAYVTRSRVDAVGTVGLADAVPQKP